MKRFTMIAMAVAMLAGVVSTAGAVQALPASTPVVRSTPAPVPPVETAPGATSFMFRDTPIAELFEMIARRERINITLGKGVTGNVAVSLYDMTPREAIFAIAEAGGFQVLTRANGYLVVSPAQAAAETTPTQAMQVRALKVQYSDPALVADILGKYVGRGGKITVLPQRQMIVVEDTPEGMARIVALLREVDVQPRQIMIEAKILEITLDANENFGIDWTRIFSADGANTIGTTGLAQRGVAGLVFNYVNRNVDVYLSALSNKGRVRTLATPKLLALENQEATTNIGDKLGYRLTTTINNVTSESIQFLETGVILRVTPSVDSDGKIVLRVRPEVSSGSVSAGIPSKKTTEVSTQMVAEDGQSILIAGLIKTSEGRRRIGIPLLGDVPGIGKLFSNNETTGSSTETIVMITPRIVRDARTLAQEQPSIDKVQRAEQELKVGTGAATSLE
ncbi:MAG TPA: secretin N-terminal domain-containing protein [Telluria sp.]